MRTKSRQIDPFAKGVSEQIARFVLCAGPLLRLLWAFCGFPDGGHGEGKLYIRVGGTKKDLEG